MKLVMVYNPKSGSAISREELQKKCEQSHIEVKEFIPIGEGLEQPLAPYIEKGETIAVIGGDGTVSAVANQVVGTDAVLVPLPGGTLNHFTKDLSVPQDVDQALDRLSSLAPRSIDVACMNDDIHFINNSSIGLYPNSLRDREKIESKVGKWPAAVIASLRAFIQLTTYRVTIDAETFDTPFIFIGNNHYSLDSLGGTERSSLDEGLLTVLIAKTQSRTLLLKIAFFTLIGRAKQVTEFEERHVSAVTIDTKRHSLSVSYDGEVTKLPSPLVYKVKPGQLTVLA